MKTALRYGETSIQNQLSDSAAGLLLPCAPASETATVQAWSEEVALPTFLPGLPDPNPLFLEKRVYQGSSGRVYPLPCIDRIASAPVLHSWKAVHLENEYLRVMILPEIGGRIHVGLDKRNGYDFFYRQNVIKPALVGLAGPWISGGVEFNWPQHHRPATFMPVEIEIEREDDGAVTVWCGDHDPMLRMKGMHGVRLTPGVARIELRVRLYNRTQLTQTFLWWANVAARVHEHYQSFFPPDVRYVADHAKRAVTSFPLSDRPYYGVDYPRRAREGVPETEAPGCFGPEGCYPANDLSWYANIPVPTSYMVTASQHDFFGGYDHAANAGFVHVANHHIAPGKKQWTWGNHEFGYAWDRSLTDRDGPYIELMAGVYTDNQPDFSYLAPGETKSFSQFWYPLSGIGVPQAANADAAMRVTASGSQLLVAIVAVREMSGLALSISCRGRELFRKNDVQLTPRRLFCETITLADTPTNQLTVELRDRNAALLRYAPAGDEVSAEPEPELEPEPATEPRPPQEIATLEELYLTGVHLEQYRHATRAPEAYWQEALRRDAGESRSNCALGLWRLRRGELAAAAQHFRTAIARLTARNPNPPLADAHSYLGVALRYLGEHDHAYAAFYKATWIAAWRAPAYHALAEMDCAAGRWPSALDHIRRSLRADTDNNNAISLACVILRRLDCAAEADSMLAAALRRDPLDYWFRYLESSAVPADTQASIDLALDMMRAGLLADAQLLLSAVLPRAHPGAAAIAQYLLASLHEQSGDTESAHQAAAAAAASPTAYVFPSRIEEMLALEAASRRNPQDARAHYYLGNFLYDRNRRQEAIRAWERATALDPSFPTAWRNLGIGRFNILHDRTGARDAYERAFAANPGDARVLYERDQLWKRLGASAAERLAELNRFPALVQSRDDLSLERATLLNRTGAPNEALRLLLDRHFQPWEGGEGLVLAQYVRSHLLLGQQALRAADPARATAYFQTVTKPPRNLGEARHLLANQSNIHYWLGIALAASGEREAARLALLDAARHRGDFQKMSVQPVSEMTYWSALALQQLGQRKEAERLLQQIHDYAEQLDARPAVIDYFATSLPTMLLFDEDLETGKHVQALFLEAQSQLGRGQQTAAQALLQQVLALDPNHQDSADLLRQLDPLAAV